MDKVYVFNSKGRYAGGVFSRVDLAERWISQHRLTGLLTAYPLDVGFYDYAVKAGWFSPKRDEQRAPNFISSFTSARSEHYHYEDGKRVS
jgi:hypothetical protein